MLLLNKHANTHRGISFSGGSLGNEVICREMYDVQKQLFENLNFISSTQPEFKEVMYHILFLVILAISLRDKLFRFATLP